ncbi:MAG: superoxide dismutase [Bdellovibrionaceae bacterium]|nr:superoxide dismutase [Pseudobdellovibrionaceae bacterium]MDW8190894.1 superoxide dismutase [Pseudobdellovibrionaceae bacterium]
MASFTLRELPFSKQGIPGFLSAETIEFHYGKHHQGYVNKLNELLPGSGFEGSSLEDLVLKAQGALFNNAAQVWNHDFYWLGLSPSPQKPGPMMQKLINMFWGNEASFRKEFEQKATTLFGSGWCGLVWNPSHKRTEIVQTSNAENPMRQGLVPLLTCDVWEHAYYIDYRNSRPNYFAKWWDHINWDFVESLLKKHNVTV